MKTLYALPVFVLLFAACEREECPPPPPPPPCEYTIEEPMLARWLDGGMTSTDIVNVLTDPNLDGTSRLCILDAP